MDTGDDQSYKPEPISSDEDSDQEDIDEEEGSAEEESDEDFLPGKAPKVRHAEVCPIRATKYNPEECLIM